MTEGAVMMYIAALCLMRSCDSRQVHRPTSDGDPSSGSFVDGVAAPDYLNHTEPRLHTETVADVTRPVYVTADAIGRNARTLFPVGLQPTTATSSPFYRTLPEIITLRKPKHLDADEFVTELPDSQTSGFAAQTQRDISTENGGGGGGGDLKKLYIGGLFDLSGGLPSTKDFSELAAAQLALHHINEQRYVPGYQLELVYNDTKCDPGYGAEAFYDLMYRKPQLIMLVATSCSEVAKTLGEIVSYWNLLLVSYAATSPALSARVKYPTFFRLVAADSSHNGARTALVRHFGWDTIATIHEDSETYALAMNDMTSEFEKANITLAASATIHLDGGDGDLKCKMERLKDSDARIIIGLFPQHEAGRVMCQAYHLEMYGPRYVWVLLGMYDDKWWLTEREDVGCTTAQLAEAVSGYWSVNSLSTITAGQRSVSGMTSDDFLQAYDDLHTNVPLSSFARLAYDSVWTVAMTLRATQKQQRHVTNDSSAAFDSFRYQTDSGRDLRNTFLDVMGNLEFMGISGPVSFDGPDRRCISVLQQHQDGVQVPIAFYFPENKSLSFNCIGCKAVVWKDGKIPHDKFTIVPLLMTLDHDAFIIVSSISVAGMALAFFSLGFSLHNRKLKYIKLSSPTLNNVAVVGCILIYVSVILLGLDDATIHVRYFATMCMTRVLLWSTGFSLAFGAMFTKTYRVHAIFRRANNGLVKRKLLKDRQLLLMIGALLVIDCATVVVWVIVDPLHRKLINFAHEASPDDRDLLYLPQLARCDSVHLHKWMGFIYGYKGLLLLFGVYMAWETKHVKIPALSDSKYIAMNIYNVVLCSMTVVAISMVISDRPTLSYTVTSAILMMSTTVLLCLLFLPKLYAILKNSGSPVVTTSGIRIEANTRRFMLDERKEELYRAEVRNRVYKRELMELNQEIDQLERLMAAPFDIDMANELKYLLPQPQECATDVLSLRRRRHRELVRYESISEKAMRIFERSIAGLPAQHSIDNPTTSQDDVGSDVSLLAGTEEVSVASGAASRCNSTTGHVQHRASETLAPDGICPPLRNCSVATEHAPCCKDADATQNTAQKAQPSAETCGRCGSPPTREPDESTGRQHRYQEDVKHNRLYNVGSSNNGASWHRCGNSDNEANFYKTYVKRKLRHRHEYYRACCNAHYLLPNRRKSNSTCTDCDNNKPVWIERNASRSNESLYCKTTSNSGAESTSADSDLLWLPRVGEQDTLHCTAPDSLASTSGSPTAGSRISVHIRVRDDCTRDDTSRESYNSGTHREREKRIKCLQRQLNVLQQELLMLGGCDLGVTYF